MKKQPYIPVLPGHIKDADDSRTTLIEALGLTGLTPMDIGDYNDGRNDPPIAAVQIDGKQYSLKQILSAFNSQSNAASAFASKEAAETAAAAAAARAFAVVDDGSGLVFTPPESEA